MSTRLMIHLSDDEQRELHAVAAANRRDIRDEIMLLAMKALRQERQQPYNKKGRDERTASAQ